MQSKGLLVMVHELPEGLGRQVMALNFGADPIEESVVIEGARPDLVRDMLTGEYTGEVDAASRLPTRLARYEGKSLLLGALVGV